MQLTTVGPLPMNENAIRDEVANKVRTLNGPARLALVFMPYNVEHTKYLQAVRKSIPSVPLVGASQGGASFTERGLTTDGMVVGLLTGEDFDVCVEPARELSKDSGASIKTASGAIRDRLRGDTQQLFAMADAFACDGEDLVAKIRDGVPSYWRLFGGTAGDDWKFDKTFVFHNDEALRDAAVLIGLGTREKISIGVLHGWERAPGARSMVITKISGNLLHEIDDRPAATVYAEELKRLGLFHEGLDLVQAIALNQLGIRSLYGEQLRIRAPLGVKEDGTVVLASSVREGSHLCVVKATPDQVVAAGKKLASEADASAGAGKPRIVFDCAARLQLLKDRYRDEVNAFAGAKAGPMIGMACYGEIAKFGGSVDGFHNTTAVMVSW